MRENGFVFASAIFLPLMSSLLGLSGMQASRMETTMTRNSQSYTRSLLDAGTAVTEAERRWKSTLSNCLWNVNACHQDIISNLDPIRGKPGTTKSQNEQSFPGVNENVKNSISLEWVGQRTMPGDSPSNYELTAYINEGESGEGNGGIGIVDGTTGRLAVQVEYRRRSSFRRS